MFCVDDLAQQSLPTIIKTHTKPWNPYKSEEIENVKPFNVFNVAKKCKIPSRDF